MTNRNKVTGKQPLFPDELPGRRQDAAESFARASVHTLVAGAEFDEACGRTCWYPSSQSAQHTPLPWQGMAGNTLETLESTWNRAELPVKYGKRGSHKLLDGFILRFWP